MSVSWDTVFFTVTESELPAVVPVVPLFPRTNATIMSRRIAPPTIHTHGWVYHIWSVVVVDVVEDDFELLLLAADPDESCASAIPWNNTISTMVATE